MNATGAKNEILRRLRRLRMMLLQLRHSDPPLAEKNLRAGHGILRRFAPQDDDANLDSYRSKWVLTVIAVATIAAVGCGYQWYYNRERARITVEVTGFYRKYFDREPDAAGLAHWVRWAQDRWGLEKVEQLGFIAVKEKEAVH